MVHANVLAALEVKVILGPVPLQVLVVARLVTAGDGLTVTVIEYGAPAHEPVVAVGVTKYCTVPAEALLGLVSVWLIVPPEPALAPVMPPVMVPMIHVNEPGTLDVKVIFGSVPLHILSVAILVTTGAGFTVTTIE